MKVCNWSLLNHAIFATTRRVILEMFRKKITFEYKVTLKELFVVVPLTVRKASHARAHMMEWLSFPILNNWRMRDREHLIDYNTHSIRGKPSWKQSHFSKMSSEKWISKSLKMMMQMSQIEINIFLWLVFNCFNKVCPKDVR